MNDPEKLRELARFIFARLGENTITLGMVFDLRRIADLLDAVPPEVLKALAKGTWKAVPVEPTKDQLRAVGCHAMMDVTVWDAARDDYRAMITAAPEKPE